MTQAMDIGREKGARFKRQRAEMAIALAMQNRWEEAVTVNQSILAVFPEDVESHNRLGRALMELGRYDEARDSYSRALRIEPTNTIAQKNIARLTDLKAAPSSPTAAAAAPADPTLFIEEAGKTAVVVLQNLGAKEVRAKITAGDQVQLSIQGQRLLVTTPTDEYIGQVEPRLASRLISLMQGGNRYEAAVTSANDQQMNVIIREVYQSPDLLGRPSFPSRAETGFRPYIKESILQYGLEEDEEDDSDEEEETPRWEEEPSDEAGFVTESLPTEEDGDDEEEEEI